MVFLRLVVHCLEEDRKLVEDYRQVHIQFAILDISEGCRCFDCVTTGPLEDQFIEGSCLGVASNAANLRLDDHGFLLGLPKQAFNVF